MGKFITDHAGALVDVAASGTPASFTKASVASYSELTDALTTTTETVSGHAIETQPDPTIYEALKLVAEKALSLLFVPTTYGGEVKLGMSITWNAIVFRVVHVRHLAPDGVIILSKVVLSV